MLVSLCFAPSASAAQGAEDTEATPGRSPSSQGNRLMFGVVALVGRMLDEELPTGLGLGSFYREMGS